MADPNIDAFFDRLEKKIEGVLTHGTDFMVGLAYGWLMGVRAMKPTVRLPQLDRLIDRVHAEAATRSRKDLEKWKKLMEGDDAETV